MYNTSPETIRELRLRVLKYSNSSSKLVEFADGVLTDPVPTGNHRYRILVEMALEGGTEATVVITKIRTGTGVWFIEPDALNNETKVKTGATVKLQKTVTYQPNIDLTRDEKSEILRTVLNHLAIDANQANILGNRRRLLVSRDDCSYSSRLRDSVRAEVLSLDAIQAIADKEQRAVYIRCGEFDIEGSQVRVHLVLNDRLARGGKPIAVPFHYNFEFVLIKNAGKWVIQKCSGYT